jgi:predicted component of type VI protein secretion system
MEVRLRVMRSDGRGRPREVPLTLNEAGIDIGRALTSDLCLEDAERFVSGLHARIQAREGGIWLTDLSRNGTYLNDAPDPIPVQRPVELRDGDRLGIGPYEVRVWFGAASVVEPQSAPADVTRRSETRLEYRSEARTSVLNRFDPGPELAEESKTDVLNRFDPGPELAEESKTAVLNRFDPGPELAEESKTAILSPFDESRTEILGQLDAGHGTVEESATAVWSLPPLETRIVRGPEAADDPGAMPPVLDPAMAAAMDAGLQAARRALLARFEPAALEQRLVGDAGLDQEATMEDKAKCWEGFSTRYEQLAAEAGAEFMQCFDEAFARAYRERSGRLAAAHDGSVRSGVRSL